LKILYLLTKKKEKDGEETGRGIRLLVQGCTNRRFWRREIEPPLPIHSQRVLLGVQVHHWRRIRHTYSSGSLSLSYSLTCVHALYVYLYTNICIIWIWVCLNFEFFNKTVADLPWWVVFRYWVHWIFFSNFDLNRFLGFGFW
jgi:hypothetical protein